MNKGLSDNQVEQFHEQGYLTGLRVWDDRVVERAQTHFRIVTAELESHGLDHNDVNGWWALNRTYWNLCSTPGILNCLEDLLGGDLFIFGGQYFLKNPGDGRRACAAKGCPPRSGYNPSSAWPGGLVG